MSEIQHIPANTSTSSAKMLTAMVGIGVLCALLIVFTYEGTQPRIAKLKAEALEQAIFKVIPGITNTRAFQIQENGHFIETIANDKSAQLVYAGYDDKGNILGIAVEASGQGYADIIRVLYGYNPKTQTIIGFYVLESKETPGLGDKIEKDANFLANFNALDVSLNANKSMLNNLIITVKNGAKQQPWEIDGITGATISSRAIGDIIGRSSKEMIPLLFNSQDTFMSTGKESKDE